MFYPIIALMTLFNSFNHWHSVLKTTESSLLSFWHLLFFTATNRFIRNDGLIDCANQTQCMDAISKVSLCTFCITQHLVANITQYALDFQLGSPPDSFQALFITKSESVFPSCQFMLQTLAAAASSNLALSSSDSPFSSAFCSSPNVDCKS